MIRIGSIVKVEKALKDNEYALKPDQVEGFEIAKRIVSQVHQELGEELEQAWLNRKNEEAVEFVNDPEKVEPLNPRLLDDKEIYEEYKGGDKDG